MTVLYVKELSGAIEPAELVVLVDPVVPVEPVEPLVSLKAKWQLEMASARIRSALILPNQFEHGGGQE